MRETQTSTFQTIPLGDECRCEQCQRSPRDARKYFSVPLTLPKGVVAEAFPIQPATPETESQIETALARLRSVVG